MAQRKYLVVGVEDYLILNKNSKDIRYPASSSRCYLQPLKLPIEAKKQRTIERVQQSKNT